MLEKEELEEQDYRTIFYQTGLGRRAVEGLTRTERTELLPKAQEAFFSNPKVECSKNTFLTWEEQNTSEILPVFGRVEEGDILITFCTHAFGWRNGHAALVVDAAKGLTLEAVVLGRPSCIRTLELWRQYPSFVVLRLQNTEQEKRKEIARYALQKMQGIPYGFKTDFTEQFGFDRKAEDTDCSHLIWQIYAAFGYNLDSDGGIFVTPKDIAMSPYLEVVQIYGIDMNSIHEKNQG